MNISTLTAMISYRIVAKIKHYKKNQSCLLAKLFLVFAMGFVSSVYAQNYTETEPNNPCQSSAQDLGALVLPTQVDGYKAPSDVDFYKFSGTPGTQLRVTLNGNFSSAVPLTAYTVGFFASDCTLQTSGSNIGTAAHLDFTVPPNGIFIMGATACCDLDFSGSGTMEGGYTLSVANVPPPTVISGRVVDAETHAGLQGNQSPYAAVTLEQCFDYVYWGYCYYRESTQTDSQGHFRFQGDFDGNFRVRVTADSFLYEQPIFSPTGSLGYESIPIASGTSYDFGDLPLVPIIPIESISGQVKDKVTGRPLAGNVDPFALVQLLRMSQFGYYEYLGEVPTSAKGDYLFSSAVVGRPLLRGNYRVITYANQYQVLNNSVDLVNVQAHEARVAPVLNLLSNPVRITDVKPCNNIPARGGDCYFSYKVTNGTANRMKGSAWSLVSALGTGGFVDGTNFLACQQSLELIPGKRDASQEVHCRFTVPASVPANAYFCPDARFGQGYGDNPFFAVQGMINPLFCLSKLPGQGNFQVLPEREAGELMRHKDKGDHH
jgi:hypothetical protein